MMLMQNCSREYKFSVGYHWLILDETGGGTLSFLGTINFGVDADVTIAQKSNNTWSLTDVYNPGLNNGGRLHTLHIGQWSHQVGFDLVKVPAKYDRRRNMGLLLKAACVVTVKLKVPFMDFINSYEQRAVDGTIRFHFQLVRSLGNLYNLTYKLARLRSWGYLRNGTWDGMMGQLVQKNIDIGGSGLWLRRDRVDLVDFTIHSWHITPTFYFRHPKMGSSGQWNAFLQPLGNTVWVSAFGSCILIIILLKIILLVEKYCLENDDATDAASIGYISLWTFGAITQQGTDRCPLLASGRIVASTLLIFSILFFQFYSASIVSSLLMESPRTIRTIRDLMNSSLGIGIENQLYALDWFANSKDPLELELYAKRIAAPGKQLQIWSATEGMKKAKAGGYAFHVDDNFALRTIEESWTEQEICELSQILMRPSSPIYTVLPKGSPLRQIVTIGLLKMTERGIISHDRKVWHYRQPVCTSSLGSSTFSVGFIEIYTAIVALAIGIAAGLIIFVLEILHYRWRKRREHDSKLSKDIWKLPQKF